MMPTVTEVPTPDARVRCFRSAPEVDCFAVVTERYVVVVDTFGTPQEAAQMMELLRPALPERQLLVVNTHDHYDHAWGNAVFAPDQAFAAPIIAHALSRDPERRLDSARKLAHKQAQEQAQEPQRFADTTLFFPTLTFTHDFMIDGGDLTLHLLPAPGHAPDQVAVWIPELRFLLAADALEFPFPLLSDAAQLPALLGSIERLKALQPEVILPCHGGLHGPELLDWNTRYYTRLQEGPFSFDEVLADLGVPGVPNETFYREMHAGHQKLLTARDA
ncbi:MBL fold metallo-hydrolase [Deinococcus cavernae]|uniref:MBL fold metallo-hydrolase n=1 Tax=Deinococcus cavernae TaxID=2320857 RepID=A0A418V7K3_9DEIO|nr:MBL fold metallo-hydrolase [Deinococcus cavernae]RJF72077.1 MBL fold metallo-hydrolase [Deinococcus cavernae]